MKRRGFTIIEVLITMGIIAVLLALSSINLLGAKNKVSLNSSVNVFVSDLAQQQLKAIVGNTEVSGGNPDAYGIYFQTGSYVLFHGTNYVPADTSNFTVNLGDNIQFANIVFPQNKIVFATGSGELFGFVNGSNTVAIKNTITSEQKTVTLNQYGVITQVN